MQISSLSAPTVTVFNRLFQSKFRWNSSERRIQKYQTRSKTTDKSQQAQKVFVMQMSNDILWFFSKVKKSNCEILSCWLHSVQSFFRSNLQVFEVIVQVFLFMFTLTKDCSSHQKPECWLIGYIKPYDIHVSLTWRTIWKVHIQNSASIKYTMCSHTVRLLCLIKNAWSKVGWTSSRVAACTTGPLPVWLDVLFWLLALRLQTSTKSKYQLFHHCCLSCWNTLLMRAGDQRAAFIGWCVQAWERRIRWAQWLGAAESFGFSIISLNIKNSAHVFPINNAECKYSHWHILKTTFFSHTNTVFAYHSDWLQPD